MIEYLQQFIYYDTLWTLKDVGGLRSSRLDLIVKGDIWEW